MDMTMEDYVHFWSGTVKSDVSYLARDIIKEKTAEQPLRLFEKYLDKAKGDFPKVYENYKEKTIKIH